MRKAKEVLRLHSLGLKQQQIARSCSISQSTVHEYLKAAEASGVGWPLPADWDDQRLTEALSGKRQPEPAKRKHALPDFAAIHQELQNHSHLTLQLVWQEQRQSNPEGYRYSRFCDLYRRWLRDREVVLRQDHRAGEKLFVDYAGATIPYFHPETGEQSNAAIFVAVLGASSYTYAEASASQELNCWIGSHIRTFEFLGGVPQVVVPDNLRSGVSRACRYEPDLNRTYQEMATHYGVAVIPARPRKPRDKAKVEVGVQVVQRWIVAALRHRKLFSLSEVNEAIGELLQRLNQRPFRKRAGCRASLFAELDRPALGALPAERYEFGSWKTATVNQDYHIEVEHHFYSVPYQLAGQAVEARATATTVEILHRGLRVASHARSVETQKATTVNEHRPKSHQRYLEWNHSRIVEWATQRGPFTTQLVETILATQRHPEQGFRSCLGIIELSEKYPLDRIEAAAQRALRLRACSYKSLQSILKKQLDRLPLDSEPTGSVAAPSVPRHPNIRGAAYFNDLPPTIH